jgi:hypothetical protein
MKERDIKAEDVRHEHMDDVDTRAHVVYLVSVLAGGFLVMLGLLVLLDAFR